MYPIAIVNATISNLKLMYVKALLSVKDVEFFAATVTDFKVNIFYRMPLEKSHQPLITPSIIVVRLCALKVSANRCESGTG